MKIAVSSTGQTLNSAVEALFGSCPYFLVVNPASLEFEVTTNTNAGLVVGSGILSAQLIAEKGVSVVLTGHCGPNALQILEKAGIQVVTGVSGLVLQVVQQFADGSLSPDPQGPKSAVQPKTPISISKGVRLRIPIMQKRRPLSAVLCKGSPN